MQASDVVRELTALIEKHGDLPVTVALGMSEFSLREPGFVPEGPCPGFGEAQKQEPPDRFLFELKDDLPEVA